MALPTPTTIPTPTPVVQTPTPVVQTPTLGADGGDFNAEAEITPKAVVNNEIALDKFYNYTRSDVPETNVTVGAGVRMFHHLGAFVVDLTGTGLDEVKIHLDGSYRVIKNGEKVVCNRDDLVAILRKPFVKEIPDTQIKVDIS